ncbi:MAG: calcium-gated potassium channel MthK [Candidatus Micrarchaeota archaeon]|nr:MAG: calcium-gated potassium channel MthK [Candidatus Micrarchaeota archaeon]
MIIMRLRTIALLFLIALLVLLGSLGVYIIGHNTDNFNVNINSFITALYFTITTLSTVGYGDIVPVSNIARLYVIFLILVGMGVFLGALSIIANDVINRDIEKITGRISMIEKRFINKHILLIGYDKVNETLINIFNRRELAIITSDKSEADILQSYNYNAYVADPTLERDLEMFNIEKAKLIIIDLRDHSKTLYTALIAKKILESKKKEIDKLYVVAYSKSLEDNLKAIGIKNIINPADMAARFILNIYKGRDH